MAAQGRQAARQCRPVQFQAGGPGGAQPHGASLRARADQAVGLCAAGPALEQPGGRRRAGARRNGRRGAAGCSWCRATRRSATACRWARCPTCRRRSSPTSCRSTRRCRAGRCRRAKRSCRPARPNSKAPTRWRAARRRLVHRGDRPAGPGRAGARRDRRRGAHRAFGRAARRPALRLHAAGRGAGGLSRTDRGGRECGEGDRPAGPYRGLRAAARSAPQRHPRRARSRRHRGQHPSGLELGGLRRDDRRRSTRRRGRRGSAPTSS